MATPYKFDSPLFCQVCNLKVEQPSADNTGFVRGNTERFKSTQYPLWKCPQCKTIYSLAPVDFADIYSDYALKKRTLDIFAKNTSNNLLRRLTKAGLKKTAKILDYGCGPGIFLQFLKSKGYHNISGYDPYDPGFSTHPNSAASFDCIVNNDTIEHCEDLRGMIKDCLDLLKPGGLFYLGTADSEPVEMDDLDSHILCLHQPYHRIIFTNETLHKLAKEFNLELISSYRRSYHDTLAPFVNYRFLDELSKSLNHNLDLTLNEKIVTRKLLTRPHLWFYAFLGYFFPSATEPALVLRKPHE